MFEADTSTDPDYDFDIFSFQKYKMQHIFSRVNLAEKEVLRKTITMPSMYSVVDQIMSTNLITFFTKTKDYWAYDLLSEEVVEVRRVKNALFLKHCSVFALQ